jgi:lipopolysaccharide export system protein LptA
MTAKSLELWQNEDVAIARQNVTAQKEARRLEADTVKAYFVKKGSATQVDRFEAENNVVITNDKETVQGDKGVYLVDKERATLQGNVKISQGKNFIIGEIADINMKTGVSRLQMSSEKGKTKGQIRGIFVPQEHKKKEKNAAADKPEASEKVKEEKSVDRHETGEKILSSSDEGE